MKYLNLFLFFLASLNIQAQPIMQWNVTHPIGSISTNFKDNCIQSRSNDIIIAYTASSNTGFMDQDPFVIVYSNAGNLIFNWTNTDSIINENRISVNVDTTGMIYVLIDSYNTLTSKKHTSLKKLNPITGQEEFNITLSSTLWESKFIIEDGIIYLIQPNPIDSLYEFDLQGNPLLSAPAPQFLRCQKLLASAANLYIIGDTSYQANLRISKLDKNGIVLSEYMPIQNNYYYRDAIVTKNDILTYACNFGGLLKVLQFDPSFTISQQTLPYQSSSAKLVCNSQGYTYLTYYSGMTVDVAKVWPNSVLLSTDSAWVSGLVDLSLEIDSSNNFLLFNSLNVNSTFNNIPYQINYFDSTGNVLWTYNFSVYDRNYSKKLFVGNNYIYGVGIISDTLNNRLLNLFKIGSITGFSEINNEDHTIFWPNPVEAGGVIKIGNSTTGEFRLFTLNGQLIYTEQVYNKDKIHLPAEISTGIYLVDFKTKKENIRYKLCIEAK